MMRLRRGKFSASGGAVMGNSLTTAPPGPGWLAPPAAIWSNNSM